MQVLECRMSTSRNDEATIDVQKMASLSPCLRTKKQSTLRARLPYMAARLLSVSRQVGAHLWHEGPAGGLRGIRTHNLLSLACLEVQALPLSHLLLLADDKDMKVRILEFFYKWLPILQT